MKCQAALNEYCIVLYCKLSKENLEIVQRDSKAHTLNREDATDRSTHMKDD